MRHNWADWQVDRWVDRHKWGGDRHVQPHEQTGRNANKLPNEQNTGFAFFSYSLCSKVLILNPKVGSIVLISSPLNFFKIVVFPALSSPL